MLQVTAEQLYAWLNAFLWPFIRILATLAALPFYSESAIPKRAKVGLAVLLTLIVTPTLPPLPNLPTASWTALLIAAQQVLIGLALGLTMRIVFAAVQTAGEFIGLQMGLSFASFFDPATGSNTAVLSRLLNVVAVLLFLALNGHLLVLGVLARTFQVLPIGLGLADNGWGALLDWSGELLMSGMLLALPLIIVLLAINLAFGILNRTAQQLTIFAVGFPITLTIGLILLTVVIPQTTPFLTQLFNAGYEAMMRVAYGLASP
ncbi:MAG TPA: flagellar biosynthetic protein FliR [Alcaligenes sp.]|nr:flagellar biosynthetic protein FliR [Alcaligenes sp.]HRL25942.1 flagellar biosynthetic protein FliR [Alcaligenes sp.]